MKKPALFILAVFTVSFFSCDTGNNKNNLPRYGNSQFVGQLTFDSLSFGDQQVWEANLDSELLSRQYTLFTGDRQLIVFVRIYDENNENTGEELEVGRGKIEGGILHLSIAEPGQDYLFGWDAMRGSHFFYWEDSATNVPEIKGNEFMIRTTNNQRLTRELVTGSRGYVSQGLVRFLFVDSDCIISGVKSAEGIIQGTGGMTSSYFYTESALNLHLERGWNMLHRTQTFYTDERGDGRSGITMELKNPLYYRWVLYPEDYDKVREHE